MWEFVDERDSFGLHQFMCAVSRMPYLTNRVVSVCIHCFADTKEDVLINFLMNFQVYFVRHLVCLASSNVLSSSVTSANICSLNLHKVEIHMQKAHGTHGKRDTKWKTQTQIHTCTHIVWKKVIYTRRRRTHCIGDKFYRTLALILCVYIEMLCVAWCACTDDADSYLRCCFFVCFIVTYRRQWACTQKEKTQKSSMRRICACVKR